MLDHLHLETVEARCRNLPSSLGQFFKQPFSAKFRKVGSVQQQNGDGVDIKLFEALLDTTANGSRTEIPIGPAEPVSMGADLCRNYDFMSSVHTGKSFTQPRLGIAAGE